MLFSDESQYLYTLDHAENVGYDWQINKCIQPCGGSSLAGLNYMNFIGIIQVYPFKG